LPFCTYTVRIEHLFCVDVNTAMSRKPKLTREQLQAAALAIVDEQGLEGLSMRTLARALETGPMTLYNYVATREELDTLVVEAVAAGATWDSTANATWEDEVLTIARAVWSAVRLHPNTVPLVLTRRSRSPAALNIAEALLAAIARAGLVGDNLLIAFRSVMALILGLAQGELAGPLALRAGESAEETIARFRALPSARFPHLRATAEAAALSRPDREFESAIRLLVLGLRELRGQGAR
jgi:AcrR family transcriptional regulator